MEDFQGRRILVLCTDGEDNASVMNFQTFLKKLAGTMFRFLLLQFHLPNPTHNKYEIQKMAEITGGYAFFPQNVSQLQEILVAIKTNDAKPIFLWYRSSNNTKDGNWRTIQILCRRPGIEVYHRSGYFAR